MCLDGLFEAVPECELARPGPGKRWPPLSSWSKAPDGGGGGLASTGSAARWEAARLGSLEGDGGLTSGNGWPRCEGSCRIVELQH